MMNYLKVKEQKTNWSHREKQAKFKRMCRKRVATKKMNRNKTKKLIV